jgi:hypothetical protein
MSTRRGLLLAAGGAVVALGAILAIGRLGGDPSAKSVTAAPPVVSPARRDSVAATGTSTGPSSNSSGSDRTALASREANPSRSRELSAAELDSVRAAQRARRQRDSLARLASAVPSGIRKPIEAFARAIASGDVGLLRGAYPELSGDQEKVWTEGFFKQAENIKVTRVGFGRPKISGNTAEVDFTVGVTFDYRSSKTPGSNLLRQHATLEKQGATWRIKSMTSR